MRMNPNHKKKLSVPMKIIIAICCLTIVMTAVFLLRETKLIRGYRDFLRSSVYSIKNKLDGTDKNIEIDGRIYESDNFAIIDNKAPFKINKPGWMPEGYELNRIRYIEHMLGGYTVDYTYIDPDDAACDIVFDINTNSYDIESSIIVEYATMEIKDKKVYLMPDANNETAACLYLNNQGHVVHVICPLGKETLIKIVENMDD